MNDIRMLPPLRLVLNTACNGKCYFCHHEGCNTVSKEMSWDMINECIKAAQQLSIPKISLTGGEPTLRTDLCDIVSTIKHRLPSVELGITTNGFHLNQLSYNILELIDHISLSIISFNQSIYINYQGVNPESLFDFLEKYASKTTINIVVVEENKDELIPMIERCFDSGFSVDLMFEIFSDNISLQKRILSQLTDKFGLFSIHYGSTPVMMQFEKNNKKLRIKAPSISNIIHRSICSGCPHYNSCPEKICALRIYPDGNVSPCLNKHIKSHQESVFGKIKELYPKLGVCTENLYDYFLK